ncbi:Hypothetical predicted protein [Pelobates cultripes]|uniref:Uncharacterized protein n=1 Tax=Pelobates cultripes TaxID=61616 RepID=A0AAD1RJE0_PELCU|nr:Hypothetical predicted protein [Pelobates cultripes]
MQAIKDLSGEIVTVEMHYKCTLDKKTYQDLLLKHGQLSTFLNHAIQHAFQHFQHMIYEHGNKCCRLLGNLLKQHRTQLYIPKIKDSMQQIQHFPDRISATFLQYYQGLYHIRRGEQ